MKQLTKEQRIALTGFTGTMLCDSFSDFHEDVEERLGESVWTHQFANERFAEKVKEIYREDVMVMCGVNESSTGQPESSMGFEDQFKPESKGDIK